MRNLSALLAMSCAVPLAMSATAGMVDDKEIVDISGPNGLKLSEVIGKGFVIGDKMFCITGYSSSANDGMGGTPDFPVFDPDNISIKGLDFGLDGRGFALEGDFSDMADTFVTDMVLTYDVWILPEYVEQGFRIVDNHLSMDAYAEGDGSFVSVTESVFNAETGAHLAQKLVYADGSTDAEDWKLEDHFDFEEGYVHLNVVKDITFYAKSPDGVASATAIWQVFSQIPTPGAVALAGLAGFAAARRRRNI